jgi:DNA-binding response OmpR family regulator
VTDFVVTPPDPESGAALLIVEDDQALRQMLAWELSDLGYRVCATGSCRGARSAAAAIGFRLAVLDIDLPDGDGRRLAAELARATPGLRVVLVSGRHGADRCGPRSPAVIARLTKPVSAWRLDVILRGILQGRS